MNANDPFSDEPESAPPPQSDASDFFSGGSPSCRFQNLGDMHQGLITGMEKGQQRDIQTGAPKFWPDGNKCEQIVITLQTQEHDAEIDDDDGERRLYVNKPGGMFAAIKTALGKEQLKIGGTLAIKYVKNGPKKQAGFNAPKEYVAKYSPPGATAGTSHAGNPAPVQQQRSQTSGQALPAPGGIVHAARKAAWDALHAANPGADEAAILAPWRAVLDEVSVTSGKDGKMFGVAEWNAVKAAIEAEAAAQTQPVEDDGGIPF